jgi:hypothetical protein
MDRSLFLARLIGPTFVAIALGMLINLSIYERMIAEALRPGTLLYLSGVLSLLAGLAIIQWSSDRGKTWFALGSLLKGNQATFGRDVLADRTHRTPAPRQRWLPYDPQRDRQREDSTASSYGVHYDATPARNCNRR